MTVASWSAARRTDRAEPRRRTLLAVLLGAGLALAGLIATSPAAAEEIPASSLEIEVTGCTEYGGQGGVRYTVRDPYTFYQDFITIVDGADQTVHEAVYRDATEFVDEVALDPGEYTIIYTVERETGGANIDRQSFTVAACPDLDVSVEPVSCSTDRDGIALVTFSGLIPGGGYGYDIIGPDFARGGLLVAEAETQGRELNGLPPGNYYVYVEWLPPEGESSPFPVFDWRGFAVEPCQPTLDLTVTQCTAVGATGGIDIRVGDLVEGVEYTVDVVRADTSTVLETRTIAAGSSADAQFEVALPPGAAYGVHVSGSWTAQPYEEPPFVGGGDFVPLETVALMAAAEFSLEPCPVTPVTPDDPAKPAELAATGVDGAGGLLAAGTLLVLAGGLAILTRRRTGPHPD